MYIYLYSQITYLHRMRRIATDNLGRRLSKNSKNNDNIRAGLFIDQDSISAGATVLDVYYDDPAVPAELPGAILLFRFF